MHDRNHSDETPVADAVEQDQAITPEPATVELADAPIEANSPDWQEQLQEVAAEDDDREEYRE